LLKYQSRVHALVARNKDKAQGKLLGMESLFLNQVQSVVASGNCSGCGVCVALAPQDLRMELDNSGFLRPVLIKNDSQQEADEFKKNAFENSCPGYNVSGVPAGPLNLEPFGSFIQAWKGYAKDPKTRFEGSSGGVLTALSAWLLDSGQVSEVIASSSGKDNPSRTLPVTVKHSGGIGVTSGSRYAPVSNGSLVSLGATKQALIGKPCEVSATKSLYNFLEKDAPITLTFFCAGTPSQIATEKLIGKLGQSLDRVTALSYRGQGWPGRFRVTDINGTVSDISYSDSWGSVLGKNLQWRCKICPDGCGQLADVSVGDLWESDQNGFPLFEDGDGMSVIIVRTLRGKELIQKAESEGIITLIEVDLAEAAKVQSYQIQRRQTLAGRLFGLKILGAKIPTYKDMGIIRLMMKHPFSNIRAVFGVIRRYIRKPKE